jgi:large subunit ribosomal protein L10
MKKEDKDIIIKELTEQLKENKHFYLTDTSGLNAADTSTLRRKCFEQNIKLRVVKNTLLRKALENSEGQFDGLYDTLKESTSIMFTEVANVPARLIKEFRKTKGKPLVKAAYVEESVYVGDDQLETLANLKSKEELLGDIIMLLQSPMKNVVSALQSGGQKITGILKTLSEKE